MPMQCSFALLCCHVICKGSKGSIWHLCRLVFAMQDMPAGEDVFACVKQFDRKSKTLKSLEHTDSSGQDAPAEANKGKVRNHTV